MSKSVSAAAVTGQTGIREKVQKFGRFLSGMVMPNIGAFIAWGIITALFIKTGWLPNENLVKLVDPMILYLLPILLAFTGGQMVGGKRGGVMGAIAVMGVIVGSSVPMFLGAMIIGPFAGWVIKKFDKAVEGKIKAGFEMLVNNFSLGILGMLVAFLGFFAIGPAVLVLNNILSTAVNAVVSAGLLPLASIFVEPGKVLFLNNAINHGIFTPLGAQQVAEAGKSIFFMIETNPGPGLGILLACWLFGKGTVKASAPGAVIIHFLGGIHEIYFPYILMKPALLLAAIGGGMSGVFTFSIMKAGLVGSPSPGSIFAELMMTPKGGFFATILGITVATAVSFVIAAFILKTSKSSADEDLETAKATMLSLKGTGLKLGTIRKISVSCDAGMGSSAMGASVLRSKLKKAGINIPVVNTAIEDIPSDVDLVITQSTLTPRAKQAAPNAEHISLENFVDTPVYDQLVERLLK